MVGESRMTEYVAVAGAGEDDRVSEWELGLPSTDDLTPLSHQLIPPELASAFSISPEPYRTMTDVDIASKSTLSSLLLGPDPPSRTRPADDDDAAATAEEGGDDGDDAARGAKRPRLVWTPQLHKRFVDVVGHLGLKNAVPKTIMQMMNVEGLTRENVASHLQKYRLYLKRMSHDEGESESGGGGVGGERGGGGGGQVAMPVMMHVPMVPGHHHHHHGGGGGYAWMDQRREAFGSYHHRQHAGGNDN